MVVHRQLFMRIVVHPDNLHLLVIEQRPIILPERGRPILRRGVRGGTIATIARMQFA